MRRSVLSSFLLSTAMVAAAPTPARAGGNCGNNIVEAGETCDDGNLTSGDCCSATCQIEFPAACDDGDACDGPDSCTPGGTCQPEIDFSCDSAAAKTSFSIDPAKGSVSFVWQKGSVTKDQFGDPTTADRDYVLCLDQNLNSVLTMPVDGGGTCGASPCWKETSTGFTFKSKDPGVRSLSLRAGADGKAKLTLQAKDAMLPGLGGPLAQPVIVRLSNGSACWEQIFTDTEVKKNDGTVYKAKRKGLPVM